MKWLSCEAESKPVRGCIVSCMTDSETRLRDWVITRCKFRAEHACERFLRVLDKVPEEKINWSPSPTAKTPLQIIAHAAGYNYGFARVIRSGTFPPVDDFLGPIHAKIASITTLEQAREELRAGTAEVVAALDAVTPERMDSQVKMPDGSDASFAFFMNIPADHMYGHLYQIDYLQTCWNDQEVHL